MKSAGPKVGWIVVVCLFGLGAFILAVARFGGTHPAGAGVAASGSGGVAGGGGHNSSGPVAQDFTGAGVPKGRSGGGGGGGGGGLKAVRQLEPDIYTNTLENVGRMMEGQDFQGALAALQDLAKQKLSPGQENQVALLRGRLLTALKRSEEASRIYSSLVNSATDPFVLREATSRLFTLSRDSGNLQSLLAEQSERLRREPENTSALCVAALLYQYSGDVRNELLVREKLAAVASDVENWGRMAHLYLQTGANENAATALGRLAELRPESKGYLLTQKAEAELAAGSAEAAVATARNALALETIADSTAFKLAHVLAVAGKTREAADAFERLASRGQTQGARDRFLLEACKNRLVSDSGNAGAIQALQGLSQSSTDYVRKEAEILLTLKH